MDVKMEATASLHMALLSFNRSLQKLNSASFSKCQMGVKRAKTVLSPTVPVNYQKI
jgi:adenosylcobinamide amidohydrolase